MKYKLFLDDMRIPGEVNWVELPKGIWIIARSLEDFISCIENLGLPEFVSYDCDLCAEHYQTLFKFKEKYTLNYKDFYTPCGINCAEYLLNYCKKNNCQHPPFIAHTLNIYGKIFIEEMIEKFNMNKTLPQTTDKNWANQNLVPEYAKHSSDKIAGFFGPYRFLSNFWLAEVEWKGITFPSVEVAYQAAKCRDIEVMKSFAEVSSLESKRLGKNVEIMPDWDRKKLNIMFYLVMQKFSRHEQLRKQLIDTGNAQLEESNAWKDKFWGVSYRINHSDNTWYNDGGENILGNFLMNIRFSLNF
jgi:hypothetical protein